MAFCFFKHSWVLQIQNVPSIQYAYGLAKYSKNYLFTKYQTGLTSQSMVTLLMNLRSVRSEGVFVFIKSLANVTFVRLRPLMNSHYVSSSGAGRGEKFRT